MAGTGTQAFWIDAAHAGTQEHYGEQLRKWRHAFAATEDEPAAEGVTLDPLHFALGAGRWPPGRWRTLPTYAAMPACWTPPATGRRRRGACWR
ncbi:hypothetical protein ACBJ59_15530 [Nonomuraea sp. MTCD27]|uniref:hypothetical protein n=1 Tax=Nonomuraea sp. MTCD27 TaxID=1676747 RepID=UPI0035BECFB1